MADLYPIFLNLEDKPCLVVGGGQVALRKVEGLLEVGASIMVLSPKALPELQAMAQEGRIRLLERPFHEELVVGHWLVFCATDDEEVNRAVYEACEKSNIPANVVDYPPLCRFQVPGRYKNGRLQIAVSTQGGSPAFSRRLSAELGGILSEWAPTLVDWLADLRENLKEQQPDDVEWRSGLLNRLINSHIHKLKNFAKENDRAGFDTLVEQEIRDREEG